LEAFASRPIAAQAHQKASRVSSGRRMERMNDNSQFDSAFWKLLEKERLVDLSQFHKPGFFEEVPLFSRKSALAFLSEYAEDRANAILLGFALKFLKSVISYEEHRTPYFAAITVWDFSGGDLLVPNLFVWSGPVQRLERMLALEVPTSSFGKKVKRLVSGRGVRGQFEVLEDSATEPGMLRSFIAPSKPPYPRFVTLDRFRKPVSPVK
jgi:hypothetical protein